MDRAAPTLTATPPATTTSRGPPVCLCPPCPRRGHPTTCPDTEPDGDLDNPHTRPRSVNRGHSRWAVLERRRPRLLFVLLGLLLLRFADRQFCALLFQLPPRLTRLEPDAGHASKPAGNPLDP